MQARTTTVNVITGARWRGFSVVALLTAFAVIAGRELESPDPSRLAAVAICTAVLALGWLVATFRFAWWAGVAVAASSIGLIALGHFLSGSAGITAVILALGLTLPRRPAVATAVLVGAVASVALIASLGAAVPAVHALFIAAFWILAFLLGRYVRFAQQAKAQAEQLLVLVESIRIERERSATLQERARIAREIHDILADTLSALVLQLERARSGSSSDLQQTALIEDAQRLARQGLSEVGDAVATLRGESTPALALLPRLLHDFERQTGTPYVLSVAEGSAALPSETQAAIYRVAQEALTNVRRHTISRRVDVDLRFTPGEVELLVENHGRPLERERHDSNGHGLEGMRERASLLGGDLDTNATGDGFTVRLTLPTR